MLIKQQEILCHNPFGLKGCADKIENLPRGCNSMGFNDFQVVITESKEFDLQNKTSEKVFFKTKIN